MAAWDISSGTYFGASITMSTPLTATGIAMSVNGTHAYVVAENNGYIRQYNLSTAWDITTMYDPSKSLYVGSYDANPLGVSISDDGKYVYTVGISGGKYARRFLLSTAWDISTGSQNGISLYVGSQDTGPSGIDLSADGTKCFINGYGNDKAYQYTLTTAFSLNGSYASKSMTVSAETTAPYGLDFSADGTHAYVAGQNNKTVFQYNLSTAWDLSSGTYSGLSLYVGTESSGLFGVVLSSDGAHAYVVGSNPPKVHQYDLLSPASSLLPTPQPHRHHLVR